MLIKQAGCEARLASTQTGMANIQGELSWGEMSETNCAQGND